MHVDELKKQGQSSNVRATVIFQIINLSRVSGNLVPTFIIVKQNTVNKVTFSVAFVRYPFPWDHPASPKYEIYVRSM